jgi:hypothetical protein
MAPCSAGTRWSCSGRIEAFGLIQAPGDIQKPFLALVRPAIALPSSCSVLAIKRPRRLCSILSNRRGIPGDIRQLLVAEGCSDHALAVMARARAAGARGPAGGGVFSGAPWSPL